MIWNRIRSGVAASGWVALAGRLLGDRRASVAPMMALMLIPLIGSFALAGEVSSWYLTNRSMQNAADSAAIAAGTNGDTTTDAGNNGVADYQREALAVAANYGFVNGANNVTVTPTTTTASPCPSGQTCYQVTISRKVPLLLVGVVGFTGNATLSGARAEQISATAMATAQGGAATSLCITALGATGVVQDLTVNGGPSSSMTGCGVASNGAATCNGHPIGGTIASFAASGDTNDCAANGDNSTLKSPVADPYGGAAAPLTSSEATADLNKCSSSFPQESGGTLPKTNVWSKTGNGQTSVPPALSTSSDTVVCGDVQLSTDVTLSGSGTLVIENGQLDLNGNNLTASGVTVVFSGTTASASNHILDDTSSPGNKSVLNLTAPTSGSFSGIAIYQDASLTSGVDMSSAGSGPTWNLTGVIYAPHSTVVVSGDINAGATACIAWIVETLTINGKGSIIDNAANCGAAGVTLPSVGGGTRIELIQ